MNRGSVATRSGSVKSVQEEKEQKAGGPHKPPPKTCDEWLNSSSGTGHLVSTDGTLFIPSNKEGRIRWPIHPPHLDFLVAAPPQPGEDSKATKTPRRHECPGDTILGSLENIRADLKKHTGTSPTISPDPDKVESL